MRAIMLAGTGSDVGKSLLVAGLARHFARRGLRVRPFKPQNMSNNAAVTADGGEIGRAQALQARAAGVPASVHMNPVLLKPESEQGAQIVVQGRVVGRARARQYQTMKPQLMGAVMDSFAHLAADADLILVEGAGSLAEVNLRAGDIANLGFARAAGIPVVLVGDIDRGGVIASLVGSRAVLAEEDAAMIVGFLVNKFRGDATLFEPATALIAERTGWAPLGLVPYFPQAHRLPAEDALGLSGPHTSGRAGRSVVAVLAYPRISNFDDLDPLRQEPGVDVRFLRPGLPIPGEAALVVLPGSKSTVADLAALRAAGWDIDLAAHIRRGGHVLGLCGGFQMLGRTIEDPEGIEGRAGTVPGLGLLAVETVLGGAKVLTAVSGVSVADGAPFTGYEMHVGRTTGPGCDAPLLRFPDGRCDGATAGRVAGCYVHALFADDTQRRAWLDRIGAAPSSLSYDSVVDETLDALADHLSCHIDCDRLLTMARAPVVSR